MHSQPPTRSRQRGRLRLGLFVVSTMLLGTASAAGAATERSDTRIVVVRAGKATPFHQAERHAFATKKDRRAAAPRPPKVTRSPHRGVPRRPPASPRPTPREVPTSAAPVEMSPPTTPIPSTPAQCLTLGIGSNYQWSGNFANAAEDMPGLMRSGISGIREDIFWSVVQPNSASEWNWQPYDRLFTMAGQQGVSVLPIIGYGTTWASAPNGSKDMPSTPEGQQAYARFAAAVVSRFGPNGLFWRSNPHLTPAPLSGIELWNEPWYAGHPVSVQTYVGLLRAAGDAVKAVAPSLSVLANVDDRWTAMTDSPLHYWGQAVLKYAPSLTPVIDGWAIHPYSEGQWNGNPPATDAMRQVTWLQNLLTSSRIPGHIWITEVGFSAAASAPNDTGTAYSTFLSSLLTVAGPNRPEHVYVFTSSRTTAATKSGSWDYGYNLVDAAGAMSPSLSQIEEARCGG